MSDDLDDLDLSIETPQQSPHSVSSSDDLIISSSLDELDSAGKSTSRRGSAPPQFGRQPPDTSDHFRYSSGSRRARSSALFGTTFDDQLDEEEYPMTPRSDLPAAVDDAEADDRAPRKITIFGHTLPLWSTHAPSWNRVSSWVVRHAPCFWCCGRRLVQGATDRSILLRLNILCAFFASGQMGSALWLAVLLYSEDLIDRETPYGSSSETGQLTPNLWNPNVTVLMIGMLSVVIFFSTVFTLWVIREVNLVGSLRYMWTLLWIVPVEIFFVIGIFDYHQVTKVWIAHWWRAPTMAYFRWLSCPDGTYNTKCLVPVKPPAEEAAWCQLYFNATDCTEIREKAQDQLFKWTYLYYNLNGVWGVLLLLLLSLAIGVLEGIITKPVVQSSRESNVPLWLSVPTIGCAAVGCILLFSPSSIVQALGTGSSWIGIVYLVCGVTFFLSAMLGWFISAFSILNSRDKRNKICAVLLFISLMICTILLLGTIFSASIAWSVNLVGYNLEDALRGAVACSIDTVNSCTQCQNRSGLRECPEWTEGDVVKILQTQLKQSATFAAIVLIYSFGSLRFGFVLRKHISVYQIDYV